MLERRLFSDGGGGGGQVDQRSEADEEQSKEKEQDIHVSVWQQDFLASFLLYFPPSKFSICFLAVVVVSLVFQRPEWVKIWINQNCFLVAFLAIG